MLSLRQIFSFLLLVITFPVFAHEQWLLPQKEVIIANLMPVPTIFNELNWTNALLVCLAFFSILIWIIINIYVAPPKKNFKKTQIDIALLGLRLGLGTMLIMCSLSLLPKVGSTYFTDPTLFAPDIRLQTLSSIWNWLKWAELIGGIAFILGILTRFNAFLFIAIYWLCIYLFGIPLWQYFGFYHGIFLFLILLGGGQFALTIDKPWLTNPRIGLLILQILVGCNFIYSAFSVKFMHPNIDIRMLQLHNAFTFGFSYDLFVFLMWLVEFSFGIIIILGFRLRWVASFLWLLFLFLSVNLSENIFMHNFIYGILFTFLILGGYPLISSRHK